jgi:AraC family transcriptional activator FtrA
MAQRRIAILAYDGLCTFEYGIAVEIFATPRPEIDNWVVCETISVDDGPLKLAGGLMVHTKSQIEDLANFDLIIIPGWPTDRQASAPLAKAFTQAAKNGAQFMAICSGAFLLADLGMTDGRKITTHWRYIEKLKTRAPNALVEDNVLYCVDGAIMTSAGSAAGIDLCLHEVRTHFGARVAKNIAQRLVLPLHREGDQAQFSARPTSPVAGKDLGWLVDEIKADLKHNWTIPQIANRANMSTRTLMRRFEQQMGVSPQKWLVQERVYAARELVEFSQLGLSDIAEHVGFNTIETMRHHFRTQLGISPSDYRTQFQVRLAAV